jgi:hypothetical protein
MPQYETTLQDAPTITVVADNKEEAAALAVCALIGWLEDGAAYPAEFDVEEVEE